MPSKLNKSKAPTLVLSYFEAFGGEALNSSALLIEALLEKISSSAESALPFKILTLKLPVVFGQASLELDNFLRQNEWHGLLMLGQAANRKKISLELAARNIQDPRIPDNSGRSPRGKIIATAAESLSTNWPFEKFLLSLNQEYFELSQNAGEYVCNEVYFRQLEKQNRQRVGFIHLPLFAPQPGASVELTQAVLSLKNLLLLCGAELEC